MSGKAEVKDAAVANGIFYGLGDNGKVYKQKNLSPQQHPGSAEETQRFDGFWWWFLFHHKLLHIWEPGLCGSLSG